MDVFEQMAIVCNPHKSVLTQAHVNILKQNILEITAGKDECTKLKNVVDEWIHNYGILIIEK